MMTLCKVFKESSLTPNLHLVFGAYPQDRIYGDGQQAGWGYLDMDPEQTYGGLADVLYGDGK